MDQKPKLLLIESNATSRLFFTDVFWLHSLDAKFELFVASDVEAAEKILGDQKKHPDLIFVDLVLTLRGEDDVTKTSPEVGLNFITRVKNDPVLKHAKIIIYSSYPEAKYGKLAKERGADMYIYKSDNLPQDILDILKSLHGQHCAKNITASARHA